MNTSMTQPCLRSQSLKYLVLLRRVLVGLLFLLVVSCEQKPPKKNVTKEVGKAEVLKPVHSNDGDENLVEVMIEERQCKADGECILISKNCCVCASGGQNDALNARFLSDVQKRRETGCASTACATYVNDSPNCRATGAKCVKGTCVVVTQEPNQIKTEPIKPE